MLLAIDAGNTNIVFALFDGENLLGSWRSWTNTRRSADEYGVWLSDVMQLHKIDRTQVTGAIISCVVPDMLRTMVKMCQLYFHTEPMVVGSLGVDLGVTALVDRPEDVGSDRLVNAVGANMIMPGPMVVVDFGTATFFDVIDEAGNYVGNVIGPGVNVAMEALADSVSRIPQISVEKPKKVVGKSIVPALKSGFFWGWVSMVEGVILRIEEETDAEMAVIATGGLSQVFADSTEIITQVEPDLALKGLQHIYDINMRKARTASKKK